MTDPNDTSPSVGERRFRLWQGGLSRSIFAGWVRWDGERWVAEADKHDVTVDFIDIADGRVGS